MRRWMLIGLYYEEYRPIFNTYGVRIYEGYFCTKTHKFKLVRVQRFTSMTYDIVQEKVIRLDQLGYSPREKFLVDVAEILVKIKER